MLINKINQSVKSKINGFTLTNNLYDNLIPLQVATCKVGMKVLAKSGNHFKIKRIMQNKNRKDDLTIEVGNGRFVNNYGSYKGIFPSLSING